MANSYSENIDLHYQVTRNLIQERLLEQIRATYPASSADGLPPYQREMIDKITDREWDVRIAVPGRKSGKTAAFIGIDLASEPEHPLTPPELPAWVGRTIEEAIKPIEEKTMNTEKNPLLYVSQVGETVERAVTETVTRKMRIDYAYTKEERERVTVSLQNALPRVWVKPDGTAKLETGGLSNASFTPQRDATFRVSGSFKPAELVAMADYAEAFSLVEREVE